MTFIFLLLLKPALMYVDHGQSRYFVHAVLAYWLDVMMAHSVFALIAGWPKQNEWTISEMLERLVRDTDHPDHALFVQIALKINRLAKSQHIQGVTDATGGR